MLVHCMEKRFRKTTSNIQRSTKSGTNFSHTNLEDLQQVQHEQVQEEQDIDCQSEGFVNDERAEVIAGWKMNLAKKGAFFLDVETLEVDFFFGYCGRDYYEIILDTSCMLFDAG